METKFLIFDFDKTLTTEDSIWSLWKYTFKRRPFIGISFISTMAISIVKYFLGGKNRKLIKEGLCKVFNYNDEKDLKEFVNSYIAKKYLLEEGVNFLREKKLEGYSTLLVSASPENYLIYIKDILPFDYIIGTRLTTHYKLLDKNNKSQEKVRRINELLKEENLIIDYDHSMAFSDSYKDDRPMLELAKNKYLINSELSIEGYVNLKWN